jgi:Uma2 family endonuclease
MTTIASANRSPDGLPQAGEPAWDVALLYPLQGSWTEADYLELNTTRMVEFCDGLIEVLPMPTKIHQRIVRQLFLLLQAFVSAQAKGEVFFAPLPVRLRPGKYREPDIVYVRPERGEHAGQPEGADLVIEVLSEGEANRRRDLETKAEEYATAGIPEYWIVDPESRQITVLVLDGSGYRLHGVYAPGETATSVLLPGFDVSVKDLFALTPTGKPS